MLKADGEREKILIKKAYRFEDFDTPFLIYS